MTGALWIAEWNRWADLWAGGMLRAFLQGGLAPIAAKEALKAISERSAAR